MPRRSRLLLWLLLFAVLVLVVFLQGRRSPPRLPDDRAHVLDQTEAHCLTCHSHTGKNPRPPNHPLRDDCFSCHRDPEGVLHPRPGAPTNLPGGWVDDPRLAGRRAVGSATPAGR